MRTHSFSIVLLTFAAMIVGTTTHSESSADRQERQPPVRSLVLEGRIGTADKGTYQEHPFDVPAGVTRLDVEFNYEHYKAGTELEIGIFDPQRFRGTSRFSKSRFHLADAEATPSYVPGPLLPGTWRLSLGIPSIGAGTTSHWRATVTMSTEPSPRAGLGGTLKAEPGWYVGDLHAHTLHSDAFGCKAADETPARGCQPWEVVEAARAQHLDFLAITDHNTTTHHADLATMQESLTSMVLLRGQELTTFRGHANVYGTSRMIDFRLGFKGRSMADVMTDVERQGALLSINHPGRDTGDRCTGCGWDAPQTPWDRVPMMEVVNGGNIEGRTAGLPFWYARLNEGHRLTGIGGSDDHAARSERPRIGAPATVIYAASLSEAALLDGLRSGRVYIRTRGADGPVLDVTASFNGQRVTMGGTIRLPQGSGPSSPIDAQPASPSDAVQLEVKVARAAGQRIEIVRSGDVIATLTAEGNDVTLSETVSLAPGQWVHVRVRDGEGLTAIGNPIYARQ